jgi:hypothetical protein
LSASTGGKFYIIKILLLQARFYEKKYFLHFYCCHFMRRSREYQLEYFFGKLFCDSILWGGKLKISIVGEVHKKN